ncbi:TIP41-like protein [Penaeus indicus]|uniref:TIP41-like protein n=1 Tax=Penaeus indicus TaxID=29960 RepID=UPI00300D923E
MLLQDCVFTSNTNSQTKGVIMLMSRPAEPKLPPPREAEFLYDDWTIKVTKSHIMGSHCEVQGGCGESLEPEKRCNLCRSDCEFAQKVVKPYDWTFTTDFRGALEGNLVAEKTSERIDLDKLRVREEIKFYDEVFLYEDELDDNGSTRCVVKVRVMPSGFFVVFRHYLRVDQVIVRVNDTRLYSPKGASYILRETSSREAPISKLKVDASVYKDPDVVWQHLPLVRETVDKLVVV